MNRILLVFLFVCFLMNTYPDKAYSVSASSYCLLETYSGKILYADNADVRRGMASTTKIMTAIIALESGKIDEVATVSYNASATEGSSLYLKPGEKVYVLDLIYGLMLNSGNDAAVVLAEHISGDVESFVKIMNTRAQELGLNNTHFVNPNGLSDDGHYTTASDLAKLASYALRNQIFQEIVSTKKKVISTVDTQRKIYLSNHNKLLNQLDGCNGVKTGFTKATGRCLVSSVTRNGYQTVCVTLNASNDWQDHTDLHNRAHSEYRLMPVVEKGAICGEVNVVDGESSRVKGVLSETVYELLKVDSDVKTKIEPKFAHGLTAPICRGEKIGEAVVYLNGVKLKNVDITAIDDVQKLCKMSYKNALFVLIKSVFCL